MVLVAAAVGDLRAQSNIDPLVTKKTLTGGEVADIEVWVTTRSQKLAGAGTEKEIKKHEDDFINVVTKSKPSPIFASTFASKCAVHLGPLTGQAADMPLDMQRALAAVRILTKLDQPETATGLATALQSPHHGVRLTAATAIQGLHSRLKNESDIETVLNALGEAIAGESSYLVLPELYRAADFKGSAANPKNGNLMAGALAKGFAGRATRIADGARDEALDQTGLTSALSVASSASATNRKQLATATMSLMTQAVERGLDGQTNDSQRKVVLKLISTEEDIVSKLVTTGGGSPPGDKVSEKLSAAKPDAKAVRETLAKWQAAAAGL